MADAQFDPYYAWLGIPPSHQKNYYNLLGVQLWEPNSGVIEASADRQTSHVRTLTLGPHADRAQKLLNELAQARLVLLSPPKRAAYDAQLKTLLEDPMVPGAVPGAIPGAFPGAVPGAVPGAPPASSLNPAGPAWPSAAAVAPTTQARPVGPAAAAPLPFGPPIPVASAVPAATAAGGPADFGLGLPSLPSGGADSFGLPAAGMLPAQSAPGLPSMPQASRPQKSPTLDDGSGAWIKWVAGGAAGVGLLVVLAVTLSGGKPKPGILALQIPEASRAGVQLEIDGKPASIPAAGPVELTFPAGPHTVRLKRNGFQGIETAVELAKGGRSEVAPEWKPLQAVLIELAAPVEDVQIDLDGRRVAAAGRNVLPEGVELPVAAGKRKLRLVRNGFKTIEAEVEVAASQTRRFAPTWTADGADPAGAPTVALVPPAAPTDGGPGPASAPATTAVAAEAAPSPSPSPSLKPVDPQAMEKLFAKLPSVEQNVQRKQSPLVGRTDLGHAFDLPPRVAAIVVGFEYTVTKTDAAGSPLVALNTIQPVFAGPAPLGVRLGASLEGKFDDAGGQEDPNPVRVMAKEGYALAGFEVRSDLSITGLSAVFARVLPGGLDMADRYVEPVLASPGVLPMKTVLTDGRPVVGIHGKAGNEIHALGVTAASFVEGFSTGMPPVETVEKPLEEPVDLLATVQLPRDSRQPGAWKREGADVVSGTGQYRHLSFQYDLPEEYDLQVDLTHSDGDGAVATRFRIAGKYWADVVLDSGQGASFECGKGFHQNKTFRKERFLADPGVKRSLLLRVRRDGVEILVDGRREMLYQGDFADMFKYEEPHRGFYFFNRGYNLRLSKVEITPPEGKIGDAPPATPAGGSATPSDDRAPVPEAALVAAAETKLRAEFKQAFEAAGERGDPSLAGVLVLRSRKGDVPPEVRYAALKLAVDAAAQGGAGLLAGAAVDELARKFTVDAWPLKVEALSTAAKKAANPGELWLTFDEIGRTRAVVSTPAQLEDVSAMVSLVEQAAKRVGVADAARRLADDRKQIEIVKPLCEAAAKATEQLSGTVPPPEAAATIGAWKGLVQRDWNAALPLLEKAGDAKLAPAAAALRKTPRDAAAQNAFADALWDWKGPGAATTPPLLVRAAAREWYQKAGADSAQLLKLQKVFAPDACPERPGAPRGYDVLLTGVAGYRSMGPEKMSGDATQGKAPNLLKKDASQQTYLVYPRLAADSWVHEFQLTLGASGTGYVRINYGDYADECATIQFHRADTSQDYECLFIRDMPDLHQSWYNNKLRFPVEKQLNFTVYCTPGVCYLYEGGRELDRCLPSPWNLRPRFYAERGTAVEVGKFQFRPFTARDAKTVGRTIAGPESAAESSERAVALAAENLGLPEAPTMGAKTPYLVGATRARMQWIASGSFKRAAVPAQDLPECEIEITKGFWLGRYETTQAEWIAVMGNNPSRTLGSRLLPVDGVSWDDAMKYCQKLSALERANLPPGYEYRLPTDAEWEYACRAASPYAWSVPWEDFWHSGRTQGRMKQVGLGKPNAWGLFDMHGNAAEWCLDRAVPVNGKPTRLEDPVTLPTDPVHDRRLRGGGWYRNPDQCATGVQDVANNYPVTGRGFRLCLGPAVR